MNQKLVICLAFSANDAVQAERLLDFIYRLHGRKQVGHIALISNADCHSEMRSKIRVTAELAFESVTEAVAPQVAEKFLTSKFHQLNNLFRKAASVAQTNFKWPWLWLEPDCVPVAPDWISRLATAYEQQPKKYMGLVSKNAEGKQLMARVGVYYGGASYELDSLCQSDVPFPLATAERVIPSASKSDLVDYVAIETVEDLAKISKEAVVVHGDKMGLFAENWVAPVVVPREFFESSGGNASEFVPPVQPQEIAKDINEFLVRTEGTAVPVIGGEIADSTGKVINAPRLSRRQKRELVNNGAKV